MQTIINKAMVYSGNGKTELIHLSNANFKGLGKVWVAVVNTRGSHPCAYVQFDGIAKLESCEDAFSLINDRAFDLYDLDMEIDFLDTLKFVGLTGLWLGWSYDHCDDWYQGYPVNDDPHDHDGEHKYTTNEIYLKAYEFLEAMAYTALDLKV